MLQVNDKAMSRRAFLSTAGAAMAGIVLAPSIAKAEALANNEFVSTLNPTEEERSCSVDELWRRATEEAKANGEPIITVEREKPAAVPFKYTVAVASMITTVGGIPDSIKAIAAFDSVGSNPVRVGTVYDIYLTGFQGGITHENYSYSKLDSSRTLVAHITANIENFFGFTQAYKFYAEFSPSGGGWMRGEIL